MHHRNFRQIFNNLVSSWELGTRAQALTEYDTPSFSVLNNTSLPPSRNAPSSLSEVLQIAQSVVSNRASSNNNTSGPQPLIADGAAGDPASIGVSVILANWTGMNDQNYAGAATDQINFLLEKVPQTSDGAISHRTDQVQLWCAAEYLLVKVRLKPYGLGLILSSWRLRSSHTTE